LIKNFKFIISYDGTNLKGWQFQPNVRTVQGDIEKKLSNLFKGQRINLIGSGRTDSGVHALGQVANIFLDTNWSNDNIKNALNANLENDIYVKTVDQIDDGFHARFSAINRSYKYFVRKDFCPSDRFFSWETKNKIDLNILDDCALLILNNQDFTNFCKANAEVKSKKCKIIESNWQHKNKKFIFSIKANRFLHHMVRFLVGTMLEVSRGRIPLVEFENMLKLKPTQYKVLCAPSRGLFLDKVIY
jgi:tRNA pseudouridine38-40 synthase